MASAATMTSASSAFGFVGFDRRRRSTHFESFPLSTSVKASFIAMHPDRVVLMRQQDGARLEPVAEFDFKEGFSCLHVCISHDETRLYVTLGIMSRVEGHAIRTSLQRFDLDRTWADIDGAVTKTKKVAPAAEHMDVGDDLDDNGHEVAGVAVSRDGTRLAAAMNTMSTLDHCGVLLLDPLSLISLQWLPLTLSIRSLAFGPSSAAFLMARGNAGPSGASTTVVLELDERNQRRAELWEQQQQRARITAPETTAIAQPPAKAITAVDGAVRWTFSDSGECPGFSVASMTMSSDQRFMAVSDPAARVVVYQLDVGSDEVSRKVCEIDDLGTHIKFCDGSYSLLCLSAGRIIVFSLALGRTLRVNVCNWSAKLTVSADMLRVAAWLTNGSPQLAVWDLTRLLSQ